MTQSHQSIVIVPGFWGDPSAFNVVIDDLEKHGHRAGVVSLPSWGCEPPNKTMLDDAQAVREEIIKNVDAGYLVTVVMHSAGGFIAPEGLNGLLVSDLRLSGRSGGVSSLLYITAPCMSIGEEAPPAPWFEYKGDYLWVKSPRDTLFSDLSDEDAATWTGRLKHHPAHNYNSPTTQEPWRHVPCVYLKCAKDATIPVELQTQLAGKIPNSDVLTCSSGHSPFISQPSDVVKAILVAMEKGSQAVEAKTK
ncbi:hypothetical protein ACLMJK_000022 [Lecanora helva]